jgi:flagellar biosynthesis protein FliP
MEKLPKSVIYLIGIILFFLPISLGFAETQPLTQSIPMLIAKQTNGAVSYSLSIKIIAVMALLTILPALLITMSAFTRIIIVLAILRQAIGIPSVPSNQILIGLSLIMTLFVMMPFLQNMNETGIQPYLDGKLSETQAINESANAIKHFMLKQTRKADCVYSQNCLK